LAFYFGCGLVKFLSVGMCVSEATQFLSFVAGYNVDVYVEYFLSGCGTVLLEYADSVCIGGFLDGGGCLLGGFVNFGEEFWRGVEDVFVVFFGDDEGVSSGEGIYVQESHDIVVFVDCASWGFFLRNFAEDA
jgi:hypothetical protein